MTIRTLPRRLRNQLCALWKRIISYRKNDWELADYPIEIRLQKLDPTSSSSRRRLPPFVASIVNWALSGVGDSRAEAIENLRTNFENTKATRKDDSELLPRPGVKVPIGFASQDRINAHEEIAKDFTQRVLGLSWAWISDESSLWDFHEDETNGALLAKITEVYGVNVSDIESARLWEIFERIETAKSESN